MIACKLTADELDIRNCRGRAYDNAATMAGCHTGMQQRIKDINPNAEFVPCSNHSLNLVCVHAPSVEIFIKTVIAFQKDSCSYRFEGLESLEEIRKIVFIVSTA
ncbi:uncharacterized protein TNIN_201321 [Trichonephila inaurata madagascariensis]|uniref:DUF4371 domain-containing protein n=1 Tax=Trichonephila inaurata madagascariensis TaxID=2747483 RepID=A0A8X7CTS2_9ARAC|nr:uncharacterized protein TNIN_201321 [Trichonephila inaurata madagascariensis]